MKLDKRLFQILIAAAIVMLAIGPARAVFDRDPGDIDTWLPQSTDVVEATLHNMTIVGPKSATVDKTLIGTLPAGQTIDLKYGPLAEYIPARDGTHVILFLTQQDGWIFKGMLLIDNDRNVREYRESGSGPLFADGYLTSNGDTISDGERAKLSSLRAMERRIRSEGHHDTP